MKRTGLSLVFGMGLLLLFCAGSAAALDVERFLDRLPRDQREKIMGQAQDAINKMSKSNAEKKKAQHKASVKMTTNLVKDLFKKAEEAYKNGDFAAAYNYYLTVVNANVKGVEKLQDRARERLTSIEAEALARYNQADIEYRKGEHVKSAELLEEVISEYPYTSVANKCSTFLRRIMSEPKAAADIGFARGMKYEQAEDFYNAVKEYKKAAEKYGPRDDTSPSQWYTGGIRAKIRLEQLLDDPYVKEAIARAERFAARSRAPSLLANARNYIWNKRNDLAREELETLIREFPDSEEAAQAKTLLETIQ